MAVSRATGQIWRYPLHQIGPNDIWFMSFRGGNLTLSWCSKLIYLWHGLQFSYKDFVCRFSKIKSRYKSNHSKWSWSYFLILCNYHWSSHIRSYNENFKFPCPDLESPQKTSPDTSWTIPNGAGHISQFCAAITDLAILGATMGISNFPVQIQNLLKKWTQIRIEWSNLEQVTWPSPGAPITILGIAGATGQNRHFCVQIHDLLKKWVWVQVKPSKMKGVKFHTARVSSVFHIFLPN
jgi:hypothetical protein